MVDVPTARTCNRKYPLRDADMQPLRVIPALPLNEENPDTLIPCPIVVLVLIDHVSWLQPVVAHEIS